MASPMPLVPPVTSARLPVNSVSEEALICVSLLELPLAASPWRISPAMLIVGHDAGPRTKVPRYMLSAHDCGDAAACALSVLGHGLPGAMHHMKDWISIMSRGESSTSAAFR